MSYQDYGEDFHVTPRRQPAPQDQQATAEEHTA